MRRGLAAAGGWVCRIQLFHADFKKPLAPNRLHDGLRHGIHPSHVSLASPIHWPSAEREQAFAQWLVRMAQTHAIDPSSVRAASADASFRRYFRVDGAQGSRVVMDAPPTHENCHPFVHVSGMLVGAGLHAPQVLDWDEPQGFMLLSDLGDITYLQALQGKDATQAKAHYSKALDALVKMQGIASENELPPYDRALLQRELDLFPEWYVKRQCAVELSDAQRDTLTRSFELILQTCLAQPRVMVHRDYHSRNLMLSDPAPGILDFQDAVHGPITYDLASLLRDAYIEWDEEVQIDWAVRYWERARRARLPVAADFGEFWRDFEWMGLQRHIKVLGIFARLYHRDGKDGYLKDLPLVWRYAHSVCVRYAPLTPLAQLLEQLAGTQRESGYTF
jgi:aminoglycoside/choline kinase family phosphotransferase